MNGTDSAERVETVIIGAGQAGLSTGYYLSRRGRQVVILEASRRVGDVWRQRFDSLQLYSPAKYDGLPGLPYPAPPWSFPTGHEFGDYLESYAQRFHLPVRTGAPVDLLAKENGHYVVIAAGRRLEADNVVVASGTFQDPITPDFAADLDPEIRQLHSADYRNPSQLAGGPVLVVGAGHSGADIAFELATAGHHTTLSGKDRGQVPVQIDRRPARLVFPILFFVWTHVLNERTPIGRKARHEVRAHGGPLIRHKRADLRDAGVERVHARTVGVENGRPVLEDGRVLDVANVIWCTGFGKDTSWIKIPVTGTDGWPKQRRGVVAGSPGLYFVGLPFLRAFSSMLVGGVGRDAEYVAKHIASRSASGRPAAAHAVAHATD